MKLQLIIRPAMGLGYVWVARLGPHAFIVAQVRVCNVQEAIDLAMRPIVVERLMGPCESARVH